MTITADSESAAAADAGRMRERLAVLVDANAAMKGPVSMDARLRRVTAALVPRFGDVASIALFDADGAPLDLAVASSDPADAASVARAWTPAWRGLRESRPGSGASADVTAELAGRDVAVVPLANQGAAVGGLLVATRSGPYTIDDVLLFSAIADRVALAVENWRGARGVELERARVLQIVSDAPVSLAVVRGPAHAPELVNVLAARVRPRSLVDDAATGGAAAGVAYAYASGEVVASAEVPVSLARDDGGAHDDAYVDFVHKPVRGAGGVVDGVISVGVDVTERVAARRRAAKLTAELHRSEETFRAAFSHAAFGMAITDPAGRYLRVNDAFCAITGRAAEQLVGAHFSSITHASDHPAGAAALAQLQGGEINVITLEKRYVRPDGAVVWVNLSASVVRDDRGAPTNFVSMIEDVSERRRLLARERAARAEAEQANQLKDQFLATVSHELRTPLNAMLGWLMLLRSERIPPERRPHALETVERNAKVQVQLVEDLLDIARIISG
ncbi:MAG TPA: PAS domain S-box protein, partial [Byssovorax sp.]